MEFKKNTSSDLIEDGYQVFESSDIIKEILNKLFDYESIDNIDEFFSKFTKISNDSDIFRTKLGDIKQIQNINNELLDNLNLELSKLLGFEKYKILNNQLFCKPPNYKMTSAHQDNAYFDADINTKIYTIWIPLMDVSLLNGCMFYVPGSHKDGVVEHRPIGTNLRTRTGVKGVSVYSDFYKNSNFVQVDMKKYQILIHDKNTMHFSSPNLTDNYRIALTCIIKKL